MTSVADVRRYLEQLLAEDTSKETDALRVDARILLTELARADDKSLSEFSEMLFGLFSSRQKRTSDATTKRRRSPPVERANKGIEDEARFLSALQSALLDDAAFSAQLQALEDCKAVGREGLNRIYNALFRKQRPLGSKASRAKLLRDILDERVVAVRSKKAAELLLGRRPVQAE